jgi:hypothetical protein
MVSLGWERVSKIQIIKESIINITPTLYLKMALRYRNMFFYGVASQRGPWPPHSWGFWITHDATQLVGLLWKSDQLVAETSTWLHTTLTKTNIHAPGGIRTHNPSMRAAADPQLRPRGHWDRLSTVLIHVNLILLTPRYYERHINENYAKQYRLSVLGICVSHKALTKIQVALNTMPWLLSLDC